MPDALDRKLAELEHRLLAGHEQIGRGVGVPFLLLLYPPSEELRVCRDVNSLVAKLRAEVLAEALVERVITVQQQMSGPGVVVLTRVGALHPFLLPNIVQERLAGRRVHVPVVFLVPAEDDSGSDYLFLGVEKARRYRGTYL